MVRARVRAWPDDPSIRHLVLLDLTAVPTVDEVRAWVDELRAPGPPSPSSTLEREPDPGRGASPLDAAPAPSAIRTGALFPEAADAFRAAGFGELDRLALLRHDLDRIPRRRPRRPAPVRLHRLRPADLAVAARLDAAAFPPGWANDEASLLDIADATPSARLRLASRRDDAAPGRPRSIGRRGEPVGFAITGRAGPTGYLQRLAVHPRSRRAGAARLLVEDSIRWSAHRGADQLLVNTGVANAPALELYERTGFRRLDAELVVLELPLAR